MTLQDRRTIPAPKSLCEPNPPSRKKCPTHLRKKNIKLNANDLTKKELQMIAKKINLNGRSKMNKHELMDVILDLFDH